MKNHMRAFSTFILLMGAYNPITTYIFNNTGFFGASIHQISLIISWSIFILINNKIAVNCLTHRNLLCLFILLAYSVWSLINGVNFSSMMNSFADVAYLLEIWMFYFSSLIISRTVGAKNFILILYVVLFINAVGIVVMYTLLSDYLYFTLQLGPIRVSRALDFMILTGAMFLIYCKYYKYKSGMLSYVFLVVIILSNIVGFSRGVWLALLLVFTFDLTFKCLQTIYLQRLEMRARLVMLSLFTVISVILLESYFNILGLFITRLVDLDYDTASIGGRFEAYYSLFLATFTNFETLLFGQGAGALMPGLSIPASSSPSFFATVLYVHGFPVFLLFVLGTVYLLHATFRISFKNVTFGRFPFYNLMAHVIVLNIFPTVNHFPILGFSVLISMVLLGARRVI